MPLSSPPMTHLFYAGALCSALWMSSACHKARQNAELHQTNQTSQRDDVRIEEACPTPFMPISEAQCAARGDYGLTKENPAEWGFGAGTRTLWFGRMMCEDGSMPEIVRVGSVGQAVTPSSSPESPSRVGALDVIDLWEVTCPGSPPIEVYHNMYRCGSPCSPAGTQLVDARAYSDYVQSYKAHDRGDLAASLKLAQSAHAQSARLELISLWLALVSQESGRFEGALTLYDEVLAIHPDDVFSLVQKAIIFNELGQPDKALSLTSPLINTLDVDHPSFGDALCAHATGLLPSSPDEARQLASEACEAGAQACC